MATAAVILAGGLSSRMGRDKSELTIDNMTLVDYARHKFQQAGINQVFVSGNKYDIPDMENHKGPLGAVLSSLIYLQDRHPECKHAIFLPVDMPGVHAETLKTLANHASEQVCCFIENNFPFITPTNEHLTDSLKSQLSASDSKQRSITDWMKHLDVHKIPFDGRSSEFTDTNTPEEWREFMATH